MIVLPVLKQGTSNLRSSAVNVTIHCIEFTGYFSLQAPGKKGDTSRTALMLLAKLDMSLW